MSPDGIPSGTGATTFGIFFLFQHRASRMRACVPHRVGIYVARACVSATACVRADGLLMTITSVGGTGAESAHRPRAVDTRRAAKAETRCTGRNDGIIYIHVRLFLYV